MAYSDKRLDERRITAPEIPTKSARKNTKRWCKGKVGREHQKTIQVSKWSYDRRCVLTGFWPCRHEEVCSVCGKVLRWQLPPSECPELSKTTALRQG